MIVDLPLTAEELGAVRGMHTASILYALALDAKRLKVDRDIAIDYLSKARLFAKEIQSSSGLRDAIRSALNELAPEKLRL